MFTGPEKAPYFICSVVSYQLHTIKGWIIHTRQEYDSSNEVILKEIKDSYHIELAQYTLRDGIDHESVFLRWVPYTIHKSSVNQNQVCIYNALF